MPTIRDDPDMKPSRFLLVGGTGRSGTTVLSRAMARHPDLSDVPEWRFMTDPDGIVDFYNQNRDGIGSPFHFDRRLKRLQSLLDELSKQSSSGKITSAYNVRKATARHLGRNLSEPYGRMDVRDYSPNFRRAAARLSERLTSFSFSGHWVGMQKFERTNLAFTELTPDAIREACAEFLREVAGDVCRHQGTQHHLEKNTWNTLWFHRTLELLPEARLVHITRDPRDVIASYSQQSWAPTDKVQAAKVYQSVMETWWEISDQVPPDTFLEVRLEDLVSDPEAEYRRISDFWGIPYDPAVLDEGLSSASFGRWKVDLSSQETREIFPIVRATLDRYQYAA